MPLRCSFGLLRNEALCPKHEGWDSKRMIWALKSRAFLSKVGADLVAEGQDFGGVHTSAGHVLEQPDGTCSEHGLGLETSRCPL